MTVLDLGELKRAYRHKKVLITGGLGFIGSNLAHRLVSLGAAVSVTDCFLREHGANSHNIAGIEDRVEVNHVDIRDKEAIVPLIEGQDYIFNLAAQTFHTDSMTDPFTDLDINWFSKLD